MSLFRRQAEFGQAEPPCLTINGRPQTVPEVPGSFPRRSRLFIECARRLAEHPAAQQSAIGWPLGDGHGLEEVVAEIAPLFVRELSLVKWVALRGALTQISIQILELENAAVLQQDLERVMGLEWVTDATGETHMDLAQPWRTRLSSDQREAALGIASVVMIRAEDYGRIEDMTVQEVLGDPECSIPRAAAFDIIAWSAIALLRLKRVQQMFDKIPEPDALTKVGWFTDPLFGKCERYWDGSDWNSTCRVREGRQYREISTPLV
jgi:Protein of unknown function (DUF2510)